MAAILYDDLSRAATLTALTGTLGDGDVENLKDPQPRHRARLTDAGTETLLMDFGSARLLDCFALISTNLRAASSVRVRVSTSDPNCVSGVTHDSGTLSGVTDAKWLGQVVLISTAPVSARYLRWDFTDGSLGPVDIGLAPCGLLWRPQVNVSYGAQFGRVDYAVRDINPRTGAAFPVVGPQARKIVASFDSLFDEEAESDLIELDRATGAAGDVLFVLDPAATPIARARDAVWGSFRATGDALSTKTNFAEWSRSIVMTERL